MEPADPMLQGSGLVQFRLRCRMLAGQVFVENVEQTEPASTSTVVTMSRTRRLASFAPKLRVLQKNQSNTACRHKNQPGTTGRLRRQATQHRLARWRLGPKDV
jgi:hypothetical protein